MGLRDLIKRPFADGLAASRSEKQQAAAAAQTPKMRQQEYDAARRSMLGDFSDKPPSSCQACVKDAKTLRRDQRLQLLDSSMLTCQKHDAEAERLRGDMDEVESMRCAKQVYLDNDPLAPSDLKTGAPPGFTAATPEQLERMGLTQDMLTPPNTSFKAAVYIKDPDVFGPNAHPSAILAFRGSTAAKEDWENNFHQDADMDAPYYRRAVQIGNALAANDADVRLVGHSLGGGLASAAQGGSGLYASTYNSAGLNSSTIARYSGDLEAKAAEGKIMAIRVEGEVLTKTQESVIGSKGISLLANSSVGTRRDMAPSHDEAYFDALKKDQKVAETEDYATYLHGMDGVIDSMEKQKANDEKVLKDCAARMAQERSSA